MSSLGKMFGILLLAASSLDVALATVATICSNQNTGSGFQAVANNYQSNGACTSTCSGYSFAIVQYDQCWCSNIAPGSTVSSGQCNQGCPGYPLEKCGNQDNGLYGYIDLGKAPQGTANSGGSGSGSSSKPASTTQQSSSPPTDTVTSLATVIQVSSVIVSPSSSPSPSSTSTSSSSSSSSTWTPTPSASVMTVSGSVKTIVVTPTMAPQATTTVIAGSSDTDAAQSSSTPNGGFFSNKGAVAGVFTVVGLIAAGLIAAAVWFFFWRRKKEQEGSERLNSFEEERGSRPPTFMSRRTSELGLKTDLGPGATRGSDEKTPTGSHMTPGTMSRRTSIPLTDSRLNAAAMFHDNGSHMSVASLQDNQDYSRPVLQVANPDRPGSSAIEDD